LDSQKTGCLTIRLPDGQAEGARSSSSPPS